MDSDQFLKLPDVFTQTSIPVTYDNIPKDTNIKAWPYLKEVYLTPIDASIGLLIGVNAPRALEPWQIINSVGGGPYAVKTLLGWVVNGPLGFGTTGKGYSSVQVNRISIANLENLLIEHYNHEFMEQHHGEKYELSQEDQRFLKILSESAELKNGHYHLKLPFRNPNVMMPNNKQIAHQRAQHLLKSLQRIWHSMMNIKPL